MSSLRNTSMMQPQNIVSTLTFFKYSSTNKMVSIIYKSYTNFILKSNLQSHVKSQSLQLSETKLTISLTYPGYLCIVEMLFKLSQRAAESEVTGVQAKNAMSLQCLKLWERKKSQGTAVVACSGSGRSTEL